MKKLLTVLVLLFALSVTGCAVSTTTLQTTATNTTATSIPTSSITSLTTEYDGPELLGLSVESDIDPVDLPARTLKRAFGSNIDTLGPVLKLTSSIGETHITTKDAEEYLIVHILQPTTGVLDEYIIDSITVRYPIPFLDDNGNPVSEVKWTSDKVDANGRRWYANLSATRYYIPINIYTEEEIEETGYKYEVIGIQFRSGIEMFDYTDPVDISSIVIFVGNRPIIATNPSTDFIGTYNKTAREINFDTENGDYMFITNPDNADIQEVKINGELAWTPSETEATFDFTKPFVIPNTITIMDYGWVNITIVYKSGYGTNLEYYGYASSTGNKIQVYSGEELNSINKYMRVEIVLMGNIFIPIDFEPFLGEAITIQSNGEFIYTITSTQDTLFVYYDDTISRNEFFNKNFTLMANVNVIGVLTFQNNSSLSSDEFIIEFYNTHFTTQYFIIGDIRVDITGDTSVE